MFDLICLEARRSLWAKVRPDSTAAIQGNVGYEVAAVRAQKPLCVNVVGLTMSVSPPLSS
jgi:hypothetical protein